MTYDEVMKFIKWDCTGEMAIMQDFWICVCLHFKVPPTAKVIWRRGNSLKLLKPWIKPMTPEASSTMWVFLGALCSSTQLHSYCVKPGIRQGAPKNARIVELASDVQGSGQIIHYTTESPLFLILFFKYWTHLYSCASNWWLTIIYAM